MTDDTKSPLTREQRQQFIRKEWDRMLDECADLNRTTVQVFGYQEGKFVPDRTGVLFRVGESHFVITAAHSLADIAAHNIPLFLPPSQQDAPPISLSGKTVCTKDASVDIAVLELPQSVVAQLLPIHTFLGMLDVDLRSESSTGLYFILGYPSSYTEVTAEAVRTKVLRYDTYNYSDGTDGLNDFDPSKHILLQHHKDGHNAKGQPMSSPKIQGMSGGGIWRLFEAKPAWNETWKRSDVRLVAIQNRYMHDQYCKGTWIKHAIRLFWDEFPQLRPSIQLHCDGI
jgi:hypothetical protein